MVSNPAQEHFVVTTYNIRYGRGQDNVQDLQRTCAVLKKTNSQIIGLQEVDRDNSKRSHNVDQSHYLSNKLKMDYHYVPAETSPTQFGNTILSTYPIQKKDALIMQKKNTLENRSVAIAQVLVGEQPLTFMSTHLGLSKVERLKHIQMISNYIVNLDTPVILVGDWNEQPGSPAYNKITEVLVDAAALSEHEQPTFPYLSLYKDEATVRIDYIFISPDIEVIDVKVIPIWASDHLPVVATLSL